MKKIILHIGAHKTGSSYLQKELSDNYVALKEHRILYPEEWRHFLWGHHSLVSEFMEKHDLKDYQENLKSFFLEKFKEVDCVVLSSENFEDLNEFQIRNLQFLTEIAKVQIVYYIRKISGLFFSAWQEKVKHGSDEMFESFLYKQLSQPFRSDLLNYNRVVDKFVDNLVDVEFNIIVYDNLLYEGKDIAEHFFKTILHTNFFQKKKTLKKLNKSLDIMDIEVIRALNYLIKIRGTLPTNYKHYKTRKAYLQIKNNIPDVLENLNKICDKSAKLVLVDDNSFIASSIYKYVYSKNKKYFLNASDDGFIFFTPEQKEYNIISSDIWLLKKNKDILNMIYEDVISTLEKIEQ